MKAEPPVLAVERWGGAKVLIFSVPCTDVKILALIDKDGMRGAIYNPHKLTKPMPWLDRCPHCKQGQQRGIPIKIRRTMQILCSNKPDGPDGYRFTLPNHYRIVARLTTEGWGIRIRLPGNRATFHVNKRMGNAPMELQESARELRSPILLRTLKLFFSAREPNENEIRAILSPMHNQPLSEMPRSQRTPCRQAMHP